MSTIKPFILRHPVFFYFFITFALSWGGVFILGRPYGMPAHPDQSAKVWPIVFMPFFLGPVIGSLLMTGIISGRAGFRSMRARLFKWRVGFRWYAVALFIAPLVVGVVAILLSLISKEFLPIIATAEDKVGTIVRGILIGLLFGGLLEELGWTGFAVPTVRQLHGVFSTGLIVGFLHGLWHLLPTYWATGDSSGVLSLTNFIPPLFFYAGVLPAYRILMVWAYDHTESLLLCILMHASLTASAPWILLPATTGISLVIYYLIITVVLWAVVGWVVFSKRVHTASPIGHII
ncbi:MAG: CPBP family intramembrane metalloprotease [Anaerolineae bacterium]|nr:CPBP family intramembrane metalloprotease [Anaerolineae bacterium]